MENGKGAAGMGGAANGNGIEKVAQKIFGKQLELSCAFCQTFCIIYCEIIELMKCALCDASKKTRVSVGGAREGRIRLSGSGSGSDYEPIYAGARDLAAP